MKYIRYVCVALFFCSAIKCADFFNASVRGILGKQKRALSHSEIKGRSKQKTVSYPRQINEQSGYKSNVSSRDRYAKSSSRSYHPYERSHYRSSSSSTRRHNSYILSHDDKELMKEMKEKYGATPLHSAANMRLDIVDSLLGLGSPVEGLGCEDVDINAQDNEGTTPLHWGASNSSLKFVKKLLAEGARTDLKDNKGKTPLHEAIVQQNVGIAGLFLRYKKVDVNAADNEGKTPLHYAIMSGSVRLVGLLLRNRANPNMQDVKHKRSALHWVLRLHEGSKKPISEGKTRIFHEDAVEMVRLLMRYHANVNIEDAKRKKPAFWASRLRDKNHQDDMMNIIA